MNLDFALFLLTDSRPLPGTPAQEDMIPDYRRGTLPEPAGGWKEAAVLVLLYPDNGRAVFPLMLRPSEARVHAGQISLPGGSREPGESLETCALRETAEELGVDSGEIRLVRSLSSLCIPPSCFRVQPFVGFLERRPVFRPAPDEVQALLETPLDELMNPANRTEEMQEHNGRLWRVPFYTFSGCRVWGATAMILAELREILLNRGVA